MFTIRRTLQRLALIAACLLPGLMTGCLPYWGVSTHSPEGQALAKLAQEKRVISVTAPECWPLQFSPVQIEHSTKQRDKIRAVLPWKLVGSVNEAQPALVELALEKDPDAAGRKVSHLILCIRYFDRNDVEYGTELVTLDLTRGNNSIPLRDLLLNGAPARLSVTLQSVTLYEPVVPQPVVAEPGVRDEK